LIENIIFIKDYIFDETELKINIPPTQEACKKE